MYTHTCMLILIYEYIYVYMYTHTYMVDSYIHIYVYIRVCLRLCYMCASSNKILNLNALQFCRSRYVFDLALHSGVYVRMYIHIHIHIFFRCMFGCIYTYIYIYFSGCGLSLERIPAISSVGNRSPQDVYTYTYTYFMYVSRGPSPGHRTGYSSVAV